VLNVALGLGLYEFYDIVEKKGSTSLMLYGIVAGLVYNTFPFLTAKSPISLLPSHYFLFSLYAVVVVFFIVQLLRRDDSSAVFRFRLPGGWYSRHGGH